MTEYLVSADMLNAQHFGGTQNDNEGEVPPEAKMVNCPLPTFPGDQVLPPANPQSKRVRRITQPVKRNLLVISIVLDATSFGYLSLMPFPQSLLMGLAAVIATPNRRFQKHGRILLPKKGRRFIVRFATRDCMKGNGVIHIRHTNSIQFRLR
jgi:hypothetical protein